MRHRFRAGLIHLSLSAAIAGLVFLPIYFFWYPDVLYESAGGRDLFLLIVSVDVTVGPLITTIIYVPGKWGLKFDLMVIAILQLTALGYGVYVLFESRPVYVVFVKDRFELVRANTYPEGALDKPTGKGWEHLPVTGPKTIGVRMPTDPKEQLEITMSGIGGVDIQLYPKYYVAYDEVRGEVKSKGETLQKLRDRNPKRAAEVSALVAGSGRKEQDLRYLPLRAGKTDLSVVVDARTGDIVKISSLKPWGDID
jgi:hypothetical protein